MGADEVRVPRDVVVHLFRRRRSDPLLMLRRTLGRGGFWQGVSGAPIVGESDREAAIREVGEETGFNVAEAIFPLEVRYDYRLDPARRDRWLRIYGPAVEIVHVNTFAAEISDQPPALDPAEHDRFAWCSFHAANNMLDWPVEADALAGRRAALTRLQEHLGLAAAGYADH
jgi:8-oxo-dGTP pyrophosphatase MutT (NUDIX family)